MKVSLAINYYLNNQIFDVSNSNNNRDNALYPYYLIKDKLKKENIEISTCDVIKPQDADVTIYFDYERDLGFSKENYLFLLESELIKPLGWRKENQDKFDKIFTWKDDLVDNKKFFKFNYCNLFPTKDEYGRLKVSFDEKKLVTLISGNKLVSHPSELYTKRREAISWFEDNHIEDFDFYGIGWNSLITTNRLANFIFRTSPFKYLTNFLINYPSYQGKVDSKVQVMCKYKFSICFENAQMIEGYITEKIFDCFFAKTVPIYWGAPNIDEHIPKDTYIDFRDFDSYDDLYAYLSNMTESEYENYQKSAENYLFSSRSESFGKHGISDLILKHLVKNNI